MRKLTAGFAVEIALGVFGSGYNTLQLGDEQIKSSWAEVVNRYQRRADLIPNW